MLSTPAPHKCEGTRRDSCKIICAIYGSEFSAWQLFNGNTLLVHNIKYCPYCGVKLTDPEVKLTVDYTVYAKSGGTV